MNISCCAFNFEGLNLDEKLKLTAGMGFLYIDLAGKYGKELCQKKMLEDPVQYGRIIKDNVIRYGLLPDELFICDIMDNDKPMDICTSDKDLQKKICNQFTSYCIFGKEVGFKSIMIVPLEPVEVMDSDEAWNNTVSILNSLCRISKQYDLEFNIEPTDFSLLKTPDLVARMVQSVPGMGLTLDYSHYICAGFAQDELDALIKYAKHVHVRQARPGSRQQYFDDGSIDWSCFIKALKREKYDGNIAMEYIDEVNQSNQVVENSVIIQNAVLALLLEKEMFK